MDYSQDTFTGTNDSLPEDFFLIVEGTQAMPLNKSVTSVGRSHENTLVIDDPRVSRHHLEIRFIRDQFVLFDLNSSGGTYVNGQKVGQGMLYQGDVISLAGVNMVFTQDRMLSKRGKTDPEKLGGMGEHVTAVFQTAVRKKSEKRTISK
jgi:pSer/pThr/pTyr-binding forkhead associated (FHA) protein